MEKEINKKYNKEYSQNTENQEVLFSTTVKVDSKVFEKQKKVLKKKTDKKNCIEKINCPPPQKKKKINKNKSKVCAWLWKIKLQRNVGRIPQTCVW